MFHFSLLYSFLSVLRFSFCHRDGFRDTTPGIGSGDSEFTYSHINLAFAGVSLVWLDGVFTGVFELPMRFYFSSLLAWVLFYFDRAMADLLVFRGRLLPLCPVSSIILQGL